MATQKKQVVGKVTPLMKQYYEVKQKHPDALLLFRVGDFYETFGEDAIKVSQILGIVLTSRNNGGSDVELAGFPYHSVESYLPKLVKAGYRVAICEQLEKPSKEKKIVKRDVTEVVTPGVTIHNNLLDSGKNNFLCSVIFKAERIGLAFLDISTGEFLVHEGKISVSEKLIQGFQVSELIFSKSQKKQVSEHFGNEMFMHALDDWFYEFEYNKELLLRHFEVNSLKGFGIEENELAQIAAGTILHYLSTIQQTNISHFDKIVRIESDQFMWLDKFTIRNLELIQSNHDSGKSLLEVLDKTLTPMGTRMMSRWIIFPLKGLEEIKKRQQAVGEILKNEEVRSSLINELKGIGDLERLSSKISLRKINPKELQVIMGALKRIQKLIIHLKSIQSSAFGNLLTFLNPCDSLIDRISNTLQDEVGYKLTVGDVIKENWNEELDEWKSISRNSKDILLNLQMKEIEKTGISSLKVGFNSVFGYYFEVTNKYKNQDLIPADWVRKQTLKGAERYINDELKNIETKILHADEKIAELEEFLYNELVDLAETYVPSLLKNAKCLAELDCYLSFAESAITHNYNAPVIDDSFVLDIKEGRHPVIETQLSAQDPYVPNDVYLDPEDQQIIMITGPNMSGKSAVLRQTALITLMAHIGSYVPAKEARIGIVDKIFTRVGASDNISSGESTFMVEMNETSSILNNLSRRSLIILDEIGRGTSTYDGISIAWAIAEYLHDGPGYHPKTLFATHYHELSELEKSFERIKNFNVATKEYKEKVIFLRKLVEGACGSSFGIHVAQMAGMPKEVVSRAKNLLSHLESKTLDQKKHIEKSIQNSEKQVQMQMKLFDSSNQEWSEFKDELGIIDLQSMTPIECMLKLKEWKDRFKNQ